MTDLYPKIEPIETGFLDVGDGHQLYWEVCGNPDGMPAVVLHGGPGSGCTPFHRRLFDPEHYRIILFDQRNCGRSQPHASGIDVDLSTNTTGHLVADIERLREHLGVDRWLVYGNSWGSTLGLAYTEAHPERVIAIVILAVTTTAHEEIDWLYHSAGRFFPEAYERFRAGVPESDRDGDLVAAYYRLMCSPDAAVREQAAIDWCAWEDAVVATQGDWKPNPRYDDPSFRMAFARIVTHYFHHKGFLPDRAIIDNVDRLRDIPAVLIHGRFDVSAPLGTAWQLARAWPTSELVVLGGGHLATDAGMTASVICATDRFAAGRE